MVVRVFLVIARTIVFRVVVTVLLRCSDGCDVVVSVFRVVAMTSLCSCHGVLLVVSVFSVIAIPDYSVQCDC